MEKSHVYKQEYDKLTEVFNSVDEGKQKLVEGLIKDASFLFAENYEIRKLIENTGGMIKVHPNNNSLQKQTEAGKQYLKNISSYSVIMKTLNSVLGKDELEEEDAFDKWMEERMKKDE